MNPQRCHEIEELVKTACEFYHHASRPETRAEYITHIKAYLEHCTPKDELMAKVKIVMMDYKAREDG